jgi:hypothetical protein
MSKELIKHLELKKGFVLACLKYLLNFEGFEYRGWRNDIRIIRFQEEGWEEVLKYYMQQIIDLFEDRKDEIWKEMRR